LTIQAKNRSLLRNQKEYENSETVRQRLKYKRLAELFFKKKGVFFFVENKRFKVRAVRIATTLTGPTFRLEPPPHPSSLISTARICTSAGSGGNIKASFVEMRCKPVDRKFSGTGKNHRHSSTVITRMHSLNSPHLVRVVRRNVQPTTLSCPTIRRYAVFFCVSWDPCCDSCGVGPKRPRTPIKP